LSTRDERNHPKRVLSGGFTLAVIVGFTLALVFAESAVSGGATAIPHEVTNSLLFRGGNHEDITASPF